MSKLDFMLPLILKPKSLLIRALVVIAAVGIWVPATKAGFPDRPVHLILPAPAGGTLDLLGRILGQELSKSWDQPVVIENRPGSLSVIGTNVVAKAAPDGYTLGLLPSNDAVNPIVLQDLPYDTFKSLAPVAPVAIVPGVLVINPKRFEVPDLGAALVAARADPGKYFYASPGNLTAGHRAMELLKHDAGIDIQHVPYDGGPPAVLDLLAGRVQFLIIASPSAEPYILSGQLRALAVTSQHHFEGLPDIPTVAESGFPGFEEVEWYGVFAPAGTPPQVIGKVATDIQQLLSRPDIKRKLFSLGAITGSGGPQAMQLMLQDEFDRWRTLTALIKLRPD